MKSSAMRDLMALTERDDVISLAGGMPDTSTFPPDSYAALMGRVAAQSCARALQYGPTEGLAAVKACIARVMAAEDMTINPADVLVTTGGQQVIDLVCKTLLDPGDIVITVCDQPLMTSEHLQALIDAKSPIAATGYNGISGVPAFFAEKFRDELLALRGDVGAKRVIEAHPDELLTIRFAAAALDVDTAADYNLPPFQRS